VALSGWTLQRISMALNGQTQSIFSYAGDGL
jgi:hypothetical protein